MIKNALLTLLLTYFSSHLYAQTGVIDEILVVIGEEIILRSEFDAELAQAKAQMGNVEKSDYSCEVFNQLIIKKLLLHQAKVDSIPITDEKVEIELDRKIRYYASQLGSNEKLESYLGKSILQYKNEIREKVRDQMLVKEMESKVMGEIKITPSEIQNFFNSYNSDSIPLIGAEVEVAQIVKKPKVSLEAKQYAYEKVKNLRERIVNEGESFMQLASAYSDDPGSGADGGKLPEFGRGDMVAEFERWAFKLKPDSISEVFETQFGYHIMKLLDRRGERCIARHILIKPKNTSLDLKIAEEKLDSVLALLKLNSITLCEASKLYSDDGNTKNNCGYLSDPSTGMEKISFDYLEPDIANQLEGLEVDSYTKPHLFIMQDGSKAYRFLYLKSETKPHKPNLTQDFQRIQQVALENKKQTELTNWVEKHKKNTYIKVNSNYTGCNAENWNN